MRTSGCCWPGRRSGLFVALPLAPAVLQRLGPRRTLATGIVAYLAGAVLSATAVSAWVYAGGRFVGGLASGLLAVFGISAVIRELEEGVRARVVAVSSAMWILPAFVGPPGTLALEHAVGWRWALLAPVPIVLAGRFLVAGAARTAPAEPAQRPVGRTLLIPAGVAVLLATRSPLLVVAGSRGRTRRRGQADAGRHRAAAVRGAGRPRGDDAVRDRLVRRRRTGHGAVHRRLRYERGPSRPSCSAPRRWRGR